MAKEVKAIRKKAARKKAARKKAAPARAVARRDGAVAPPKVRVQMFRQGLGDSLLITFDHDGPNEQRMLIDCGTLGNKVSSVNTASIAEYLQTLVDDGKKIDFLVATHEHQDHVSGFRKDLQPVLQGNVGEVWLAWTEDSTDTLAQKIAKFQGDLVSSLAVVAKVAPDEPVCQNVASLVEFSGDTLLGAKFATTVNESMEFVRSGTGAKTEYWNPGDLIDDRIAGFRIYVLGPPRNEDALKNLGEHGSDELYGLALGLHRTANLHLSDSTLRNDPEMPFDVRYHQTGSATRARQYASYNDPAEQWRRIDFEWLNGSSDLALQLDSLTNNTSLVLAIERIADGRVLLFPADAQEGNWLSWHDEKLKWSVIDETGNMREVKAADLLARTVFYKVGHHGSHNATAKGKGLEMMTRQDELTAFIPVDRAMALTRNPKGSWKMPARPLYRELLRRCEGRVARADLGWAAPAAPGDEVEAEFLNMESKAQWTKWATNQQAAKHVSDEDELFLDYWLE